MGHGSEVAYSTGETRPSTCDPRLVTSLTGRQQTKPHTGEQQPHETFYTKMVHGPEVA